MGRDDSFLRGGGDGVGEVGAQEELAFLLDLEADGALDSAGRARLDAADQAAVGRERKRLGRLHGMMRDSRVEVRGGFRDRVMASMPIAGWEARPAHSWRFPVALLVLIGGSSAALVGGGVAAMRPEASLAAAFVALFDMVAATVLTGAGLLSASWRGLGLAVGEMVGASPLRLLFFGAAVVGLNLTVWWLARRPGRAEESASARPRR